MSSSVIPVEYAVLVRYLAEPKDGAHVIRTNLTLDSSDQILGPKDSRHREERKGPRQGRLTLQTAGNRGSDGRSRGQATEP